MDKPNAAGTRPIVMDLKAGKYAWCQCGLSKNQPFCDGSHKTTSFRPVVFEITEDKPKCALCMCKQSGNKPYCDGTHRKLNQPAAPPVP